jgi:hypothetical protein
MHFFIVKVYIEIINSYIYSLIKTKIFYNMVIYQYLLYDYPIFLMIVDKNY